MYQGVDAWLDRLAEDDEAAEQLLLVRELDHGLSRAAAKKHLALSSRRSSKTTREYRDYNATTTQSDRGEMLHTLLDFLRVKVGYERIHWNLRPVIMAHEVLIRRGCDGAAELWRRAMAERTSDVADQQLERLAKLQTQYGMRLPTIADRLSERFVRPLTIDRVRALVGPGGQRSPHRRAAEYLRAVGARSRRTGPRTVRRRLGFARLVGNTRRRSEPRRQSPARIRAGG